MKISPEYKNIIANFFKIAVIFVNQILLVPAYLTYLGVELYSDWLVISAITSFFTMTDVGVSSACNNLFTIKYNQGRYDECRSLLFNNFVFTVSVLSIALLVFYFIGLITDIPKLLNLHCISQWESLVICLLFILQIIFIMGGNIFDSVYNAIHQAHKAIYLNNISRLLSAILIFIGLITHLKLWIIVALSSFPYLVVGIYKYIYSNSEFKLGFSLKLFDSRYITSIVKPAIGFMFFPAGNAILYQGLTLIINSQLGAWSLVLFNTTRTMTNFIRNLVQAVSAGIKPEFSIAYAKNDRPTMIRLYKKSAFLSIIVAILAVITILIGGEIIYDIWIKNQIKYDAILTLILCITLIINSIWESTCITLTSTNNHFKFSLTYIVTTIVIIPVAYVFAKTYSDLYIVASTLILVDAVMAISSLYISHKVINTVPDRL